ncbi:stressosome-associated protein Prli42 [Cohnella zeiphila]
MILLNKRALKIVVYIMLIAMLATTVLASLGSLLS